MPIARPELQQDKRVIAHLDMDCFYVQVEQRKHPELRGLPTAVVQYNSWKGGGLIAVGYEARKYGVKRSMRGDEAKKLCPNINLIQVPTAHGKADLNVYRAAGSEVVSILAAEGRCERASIDEVYLDLTEAAESMLSDMPTNQIHEIDEQALRSHIVGLSEVVSQKDDIVKEWFYRSDRDRGDRLLACGAVIVARLRMKVLMATTFTCSAGIAHNKMLAKLSSSMHKPAQQTVVPSSSVQDLLVSLPIKKMKQLGGKLGSSLESELGIQFVGDLIQFSKEKLQDRYGINTGSVFESSGMPHHLVYATSLPFANGVNELLFVDVVNIQHFLIIMWLWNIARGINGDEVQGRILPKSHGCGKTFAGPQALRTTASSLLLPPFGELEVIEYPGGRNPIKYKVEIWLNELCEELNERIQTDLERNRRVAKTLTLHAVAFKANNVESQKKFPSKSCSLNYGIAKVKEDAFRLFDLALKEYLGLQNTAWGVTSLSLTASKILATPPGTSSILRFLHESCLPKSSIDSRLEGDYLQASGVSSESVQGLSHKKNTNKSRNDEMALDGSLQALTKSVLKQKGKETCSIYKFFHRSDLASASNETSDYETSHTSVPLSSSENKSSVKLTEATESKLRILTGEVETAVCHQTEPKVELWKYDFCNIDPSVVDELPPEFQREIQDWLRLQKHAKTSKRHSNIYDYFPPAKRSNSTSGQS